MMKSVLLLLLRGYQYLISPMLGQNCRFYPSCSEYAVQALNEYGAAKGSLMACKRLCKCHPWHAGGVDLLPPKMVSTPLNVDQRSDIKDFKDLNEPENFVSALQSGAASTQLPSSSSIIK